MSEDSAAARELRAFVERAERLNGEKAALNTDLSELFKEMKGAGYDTKVVKAIIADRAKDPDKKSEFDAIYDLYAEALGMVVATRAPAHDADGVFPDDDITEQQPAPAARDLTVPQALNGQVATHTLETANETGSADIGRAAQEEAAGHSDVPENVQVTNGGPNESAAHPVSVIDPGRRHDDLKSHSAGGQTNEAVNTSAHIAAGEGAPIASAASLYADPGIVTYQQNGPEPMVAHPYATCWPVNTIDVSGGVEKPIVKIGPLILDGRGRYLSARKVHTSPTTTMEYPTVQYDGDDDLADSITWNLASRPNMDPRALRIVAEKLAKLAPDRAEEIMERFGFNEEQRAAQ